MHLLLNIHLQNMLNDEEQNKGIDYGYQYSNSRQHVVSSLMPDIEINT